MKWKKRRRRKKKASFIYFLLGYIFRKPQMAGRFLWPILWLDWFVLWSYREQKTTRWNHQWNTNIIRRPELFVFSAKSIVTSNQQTLGGRAKIYYKVAEKFCPQTWPKVFLTFVFLFTGGSSMSVVSAQWCSRTVNFGHFLSSGKYFMLDTSVCSGSPKHVPRIHPSINKSSPAILPIYCRIVVLLSWKTMAFR